MKSGLMWESSPKGEVEVLKVGQRVKTQHAYDTGAAPHVGALGPHQGTHSLGALEERPWIWQRASFSTGRDGATALPGWQTLLEPFYPFHCG